MQERRHIIIGQVYSTKKYNVVILAGGMGSRMGNQSEYLPKALTPFGSLRSIDWIIFRYSNIAHKFIIGTYFHGDLLKAYVLGKYPHLDVEFSEETELVNNSRSFGLCMDHADSRYPTILTFCDLIMIGNYKIEGDMLYVATKDTKGSVGTFRHVITNDLYIEEQREPISVKDNDLQGIVGTFVFDRTPILKAYIYDAWGNSEDITSDICADYYSMFEAGLVNKVEGLVEFGTQEELAKARAIWETV